jgi:predicted DNA-binding transcriptional regulator AlpA
MQKTIFLSFELSELLSAFKQICREEVSEVLKNHKVTSNPDDEFMNMKQASEFTKKAKQTLYGLCSTNRIPHYSKSGQTYFIKQELIEWIESGRKSKKKELQTNHIHFTKKNKI